MNSLRWCCTFNWLPSPFCASLDECWGSRVFFSSHPLCPLVSPVSSVQISIVRVSFSRGHLRVSSPAAARRKARALSLSISIYNFFFWWSGVKESMRREIEWHRVNFGYIQSVICGNIYTYRPYSHILYELRHYASVTWGKWKNCMVWLMNERTRTMEVNVTHTHTHTCISLAICSLSAALPGLAVPGFLRPV
jgi:hypothetical protein